MAKPVRLTLYVDNDQLKRSLHESGEEFDKFDRGVGGTASKFGAKTVAMGVAMGTLALDVAASLAKMVGDAAAWLPKLGAEFDNVADHIRTSIGNNGIANAVLNSNFQTVYAAVASSMDDTGAAVTTLYQKLGITGPGLDALAAQVLNLSRITGSDLATNLDAVTTAFNIFNIPADQMANKLDYLFKASQATGVPLSELASQIQNNAAQLRLMGVSFDESVNMASALGKYGVSIDDLGASFKKLIQTAAKEGTPLSKVFDQEVKGIRDKSISLEDALKDLGNRGGQTFYSLARDGKLNFSQLNETIKGNTDTIMDATNATDDWPEKWSKAWHQVELAVKPVADKVFGFIGTVIDKMTVKGLDGTTIVGLDIAGAWGLIADEWDKDWNEKIHPWLDKIWERINEWWENGGREQTLKVAKAIGKEIGDAIWATAKASIFGDPNPNVNDSAETGRNLVPHIDDQDLADLNSGDPAKLGRVEQKYNRDFNNDGHIGLPGSTVPYAPGKTGASPFKRALGGNVWPNTDYIVGDAGRPEVFRPDVPGKILPRVPSAKGGDSVVNNFYGHDPAQVLREQARMRRKQVYLAGAR